ncbi:MAG: DUF1244 domain-containing protein [Thiolinea sp.]
MDEQTRLEVEAAAWRKLVEHFQKRTDVQNIDLMNMAGFCRNCMSKWYLGAANARGEDLDYAAAQEVVYGMPYGEFKQRYQQEATPEQLERYNAIRPEQKTE